MPPFDPSEPTDALSAQPSRTFVERYELGDELGSGAMGTVWRAFDTRLERSVAVKEVHLPAEMPPKERARARARMVREARAAARVSHPSVVTVHDVLEVDGVPYIVMELLDGESLRDRIHRAGPLSEHEVEQIARPLLGALWAAHLAGVVHRDVKPANIMLTEGGRRPVLTDFGIANLPDDGGTALTGTGTILGTAAYAAPERLEGDEDTAISDLWSLGATLFAALAGDSPFKRDTLTSTLTAVLTLPVPPPPARGGLADVVSGLLERDHRRRLLPERALSLLDTGGPGPRSHVPVPQLGDTDETVPLASGPSRFGTSPTTVPPAPTALPPAPAGRRLALAFGVSAAVLLILALVMGVALRILSPGVGEVAASGSETSGSEQTAEESPDPPAESASPATETEDAPEGFARLEDDVMSVNVPEDWQVRSGDPGSSGGSATRLVSYEFETGVQSATASAIVTEYDFLVHDAEGAMLRMEELLTTDEDFSDVERLRLDGEPTADGMESAVYEVLFRHDERDAPDRWMFTREISDEDRGISYRLSFNFPEQEREEYHEVLEQVLDSFEPAPA